MDQTDVPLGKPDTHQLGQRVLGTETLVSHKLQWEVYDANSLFTPRWVMDNPEGEISNYRNKLFLSQRDRFQHCIRENFLPELSKAGLNYPVQSCSELPITRSIQVRYLIGRWERGSSLQ